METALLMANPLRVGDIVIYEGSMREYVHRVFRVTFVPENSDRGYTVVPASQAINDAINSRLGQYREDKNELTNVSRRSLVGLFDISTSYLDVIWGIA